MPVHLFVAQGPAIPIEAPLLPPLIALAALLVALGLTMLAHAIVGALFGVAKGAIHFAVGWVPWLGKKVVGGVERLEQKLNNALSAAIVGLESHVTSTWHNLAHAAAHLGYTIAHLARATAHLAWYVASKYSLEAIAFRAGKALYNTHLEHKLLKLLRHDTQVIVRELAHPNAGPIAQGVKAGTRGIDAGLERLEHWTRARVKALEHGIAVTLPADIAGLRARDLSLGRLYDRLRKLVHRHERLLGAGAIAAAVAFALARLGAGWVRCGNWRRVGRSVCGMDTTLLDVLLLESVAIFGALSIVTLAEACLAVEDEIIAGVKAGFSELRDLKVV